MQPSAAQNSRGVVAKRNAELSDAGVSKLISPAQHCVDVMDNVDSDEEEPYKLTIYSI
jgi:hypothetical protein